jgi:hypothetical protein
MEERVDDKLDAKLKGNAAGYHNTANLKIKHPVVGHFEITRVQVQVLAAS